MSEPKKSNLATSFKKLEIIVASLENDSADLEGSVKKYEQGLAIAQDIKKQLEHLENKVEKVKKDNL